MTDDNFVKSVLDSVDKKFGHHDVTLDNILEILAITMKIAEKWKNGQMTGLQKRELVLAAVKKIVAEYTTEGNRQTVLDYVDTFGGMGIELVIWLSRNTDILENINSSGCLRSLLCLRSP